MENNFIKILSLNGGGVRGLYSIAVLAEIERVLADKTQNDKLSIGSYFDLIAGTSIGGILALGLADGKRARDLEKGFREHAKKIFPIQGKFKKFWNLLFHHQYDGNSINQAITSILGENRKIRNLQRRVLIPTVCITTGKPQFFKTCHNPRFTRDDKLDLVDVARATSAAPTYFSPYFIETLSNHYVDGGLIANNPSLTAYHEVLTDLKSEFPDAKQRGIKVLNIGTLSSEFCINPKKIDSLFTGYLKLWGLGKNLIETVMTSNQIMHGFMIKRAIGEENYYVLDEGVPNEQADLISLDNAEDAALKVLIGRGQQKGTEATGDPPLMNTFFENTTPKFIHPNDRKEG